jgi:NAD(P)-dependent dehydrogenase (short-subunit alcohol dehydrogenase family)
VRALSGARTGHRKAIKDTVEKTVTAFGGLDVLVNNAGLLFRPIQRPGVPASGSPEELLRVDRGPSM